MPALLAEWTPERSFDVSVAAYVHESNRSSYDVPTLYAEFMGTPLPHCDHEHAATSALAQGALQLAGVLRDRLEDDGGLECYESCELPLIPALARMEDVGLGVDTMVLGELAEELGGRIEALRAEIYELAGVQFTVDSPKQLG